jgi:hypothetical protein
MWSRTGFLRGLKPRQRCRTGGQLVVDPRGATLALGTPTEKDVCTVGSVDVTAVRIQTFHLVGARVVVRPRNAAVPEAPLVVVVDEPHFGVRSSAALEF